VLRQVAQGVQVHVSEFCASNAVVVDGRDGVLLVDPGIRGDEIRCLATDLSDSGGAVLAGFATHPHWDHVLWDARFGAAPRYGTARCAAAMRALRADPHWEDRVATVLPPDIADQVPLELLGMVEALPADTARVPWDGPDVRVVEHQAHASGHAALVVDDRGVLLAGDMLSDVLVPLLDLRAADPVGDYLAGLQLLEGLAGDVDVVVPGHGSVGGADDVRARIELDRAYVQAVRDGGAVDDPRIGPSAPFDWVLGVHERQLEQLGRRGDE
jgi:glyoxylase-like metal-dependent hydrolase (beta-lactamase superfamily II)